MTEKQAEEQYWREVALYEQYGAKNIISFDEWVEIKGITIIRN